MCSANAYTRDVATLTTISAARMIAITLFLNEVLFCDEFFLDMILSPIKYLFLIVVK